MRPLFRFLLFVALLAGLWASPDATEAAKKKEKVMPVKIVKASETKFKHAKIVEKKKVKQRGFLWFKKKEPKVVQPEVVVLPAEAMATQERLPVEEKAARLPKSKKAVKPSEQAKAVDTEEPVLKAKAAKEVSPED